MPLYEYRLRRAATASFERYVRSWSEAVSCPSCARPRRREAALDVRLRRAAAPARASARAGAAAAAAAAAAVATEAEPADRRRPRATRSGAPRRAAARSAASASTREGKLTARERVELLLDEGTFEELDKLVEHRCLDFGMADQKVPGDGVVSGYGTDRRPARLRLRPGLHRLRRQPLRDQRAEDLQGHGPGHEDGRARHRPQRLGRRAHPGGRGLPGRLRGHLPAQHAGLGRGAADLRHPRAPARAAPSTAPPSPTST